jgi:ABC-type Mn2+/Zn2+ transport system permease subunit
MMLIATGVCAACTVAGLLLSFGLSESLELSAPPGPLIILIAVALYGASSALRLGALSGHVGAG